MRVLGFGAFTSVAIKFLRLIGLVSFLGVVIPAIHISASAQPGSTGQQDSLLGDAIVFEIARVIASDTNMLGSILKAAENNSGIMMNDIRSANGQISKANALRYFVEGFKRAHPDIVIVVREDNEQFYEKLVAAIEHSEETSSGNRELSDQVQRSFYVNGTVKAESYWLWGVVRGTFDVHDLRGQQFPGRFHRRVLTFQGKMALLLLGVIVLSWLGVELIRVRGLKHQAVSFDNDNRPRRGLGLLREKNIGFHFRIPEANALQHRFEDKIAIAEQKFEEAKTFLEAHDHVTARTLLSEALVADADHELVKGMLSQLNNKAQAQQILKTARKLVDTDPGSALPQFHEALRLDPDLNKVVTAEIAIIEASMSRTFRAGDSQASINTKTEDDPYAALAGLDDAISKLKDDAGAAAQRKRLQMERDAIAAEMRGSNDLMLEGVWGTLEVRSQALAKIGRTSGSSVADYAVRHKRVSRATKQTEVSLARGKVWVKDLGSSNGTMLGTRLLPEGDAIAVPDEGGNLSLGGQKLPESRGTCRLTVWPVGKGVRSALIGVDPSTRNNLLGDSIIQEWASYEEDAGRFLLLLRSEVGLTADPVQPVKTDADISLIPSNQGLMVSATKPFSVNGHTLINPVVIVGDCELTCDDYHCQINVAPQHQERT